jgi:hypothetical protein
MKRDTHTVGKVCELEITIQLIDKMLLQGQKGTTIQCSARVNHGLKRIGYIKTSANHILHDCFSIADC